MALVRPIVYVFQEVTNVTVSPSVPSLNTCIVGPCYFIRDTNITADKDENGIGTFVKSPFTTANAPCDATGASAGKPSTNSTIISITEPTDSDFPAGAELDAASMDVVFDDCYIELTRGTDLRDATVPGNLLAAGSHTVTSATGAFTTNIPYTTVTDATSPDFGKNVPTYATRIVATKTGGSLLLTEAIIKNIRYVDSATQLTVTSEFTAAEMALLASGDNLTFRVEIVGMDDLHIDPAYYTVSGNALDVKTGPLGTLVAVPLSSGGTLTKPVSYAEVSIGYRALRKDLTDVQTLESTNDIENVLGRVDERNPLAAAAQVAFANTQTTLQVFGVESDDLAGHTDAKDKMSSRSDIYCIVPVTDSIDAADWVSVISMWKLHCEAYADYTKSKYRIVIGSYPDLPTEKSSAAPSLVGTTQSSAAMTLDDVFVDPSLGADFIGAEIDNTHLLDIAHEVVGGGAGVIANTVPNTTTIFNSTYPGAKALYGAIGKKRLRSVADLGSGGTKVVDYIVRNPILVSEGGTAIATVAGCAGSGGGAAAVRLTKIAGSFTGVAVGDVAALSNTGGGTYNYGVIVVGVAVDGSYIDIGDKTAALALEAAVNVTVYRPTAYAYDATITGTNTINAAGQFSAVRPGDVAYIFVTNENPGATTNVGMWVVSSATSGTVVIAGTAPLTNVAGTVVTVAIFTSKAGGHQSCTARKRLDQLHDATASFLSTVAVGEDIEIPYPSNTNPLHWDTTTTQWPIKTIVSNQLITADLDTLEELAPKDFVAGYSGDCPYRINIDLNKTAQVTELNTVTTSLRSNRVVMVWPNECTVTDLENALTGITGRHHGQYLACAVGGMVCGLPPHQGFTFIGVAGISQIYNSNFYFSDAQIDDLSEGGWYIFLQDSETSAPYSAHEVTTDTTAYQFGELMYVKDFDFVSTFYKRIMETFIGRWNINNETLKTIRASFDAGTAFLKSMSYPKIGTPILSSEVTKIEQLASETDRVEIYAEVSIPRVLNKIGLHLIA